MANNTKRVANDLDRKVSKERVKYIGEWDREHTKQIMLKFNLHTDKDILSHLESVGNKQGYIKNLIRMDILRQRQVDEKKLDIPELHGSREGFDEMTFMRRAWIQTMCVEMKLDSEYIEKFLKEHTDTDELSEFKKENIVDIMTKYLADVGEPYYLLVFEALNRVGDWKIDANWDLIEDDYINEYYGFNDEDNEDDEDDNE